VPSKATPVAQEGRQAPATQAAPAPQLTPQAPQFDASRCTSTHARLQLVMHAVPHVPAWHVARCAGAETVHAEQLAPHALT
jgi:hypothetical protein